MTAKEVVQSWTRPQLESAFTQREVQLKEALAAVNEISQQRDALAKRVDAYTHFINAVSNLAGIGNAVLNLDFRKLSQEELEATKNRVSVACAGGDE